MREKLKKTSLILLALIFTISSTLIVFWTKEANASEDINYSLIKKVSQSYTNKFCNAIGFGLSNESAMSFSIKENNQVFRKRKGFNNLNKELLAEDIAIAVIEKCGYPINLSGESGILEFKNYYIEKDKEFTTKSTQNNLGVIK